ncbi:hypothetical protein D3C71_2073230 [compost metagenome]
MGRNPGVGAGPVGRHGQGRIKLVAAPVAQDLVGMARRLGPDPQGALVGADPGQAAGMGVLDEAALEITIMGDQDVRRAVANKGADVVR